MPSWLLACTFFGLFFHCTSFAGAASPFYQIQDDYDAFTFFTKGFSFFTGPDPTHGFVKYADIVTANTTGLAGIVDGSAYFGVDYKTAHPREGRASTRLVSNKQYDKGLFLFDILHMPGGVCGIWPALWTVGNSWPSHGEIDIVEGVNLDTANTMTLHTSANCSISAESTLPTSSLKNSNCNANTAFDGCSTITSDPQSFGLGFNANRGGLYAMEWTSKTIKVWFFTRSTIPVDTASPHPDPSKWSLPMAQFTGSGCNIDQHFRNHSIVFNTALCGDWAEGVWRKSACAAKAKTCRDFVAANPNAFEQSYWLVNRVKVYQESSAPTTVGRWFDA